MKKIKMIYGLIILSSLVSCAANKPPTLINPNNKTASAAPRQMPTLADFEQTFLKALNEDLATNIVNFSDITRDDKVVSAHKLCKLDNFPTGCPAIEVNQLKSRWELPPDEAKSQVEARRLSGMRILNKLAEDGDKEVQFGLAKLYQFSAGPDNSIEQAIKWYLKAAEAGHANSAELLGTLYWLGTGVPTDFDKAIEWYGKMSKLRPKTDAFVAKNRVERISGGWTYTLSSIIHHYPLRTRISIDPSSNGGITEILLSTDSEVWIKKSSGIKEADYNAIRLVKEALRTVPAPEEIKLNKIYIILPISFRIIE
jgi:Sel1 repeat